MIDKLKIGSIFTISYTTIDNDKETYYNIFVLCGYNKSDSSDNKYVAGLMSMITGRYFINSELPLVKFDEKDARIAYVLTKDLVKHITDTLSISEKCILRYVGQFPYHNTIINDDDKKRKSIRHNIVSGIMSALKFICDKSGTCSVPEDILLGGKDE